MESDSSSSMQSPNEQQQNLNHHQEHEHKSHESTTEVKNIFQSPGEVENHVNGDEIPPSIKIEESKESADKPQEGQPFSSQPESDGLTDIPFSQEAVDEHVQHSPPIQIINAEENITNESLVKVEEEVSAEQISEESNQVKESVQEHQEDQPMTHSSPSIDEVQENLVDIPVTQAPHDINTDNQQEHFAEELVSQTSPTEEENSAQLHHLHVALDADGVEDQIKENGVEPTQAAIDLSQPTEGEVFDVPVALDDSELAGDAVATEALDNTIPPEDMAQEGVELHDIPVTLDAEEGEEQISKSVVEPTEASVALSEPTEEGLFDIPVTLDDSEQVGDAVSTEDLDNTDPPEDMAVEGVELHDIPVTLDTEEGEDQIEESAVKPTEASVDLLLAAEGGLLDIPVTLDKSEKVGDAVSTEVVNNAEPSSTTPEEDATEKDVELHDITVTTDTDDGKEQNKESDVEPAGVSIDSLQPTEAPVTLEEHQETLIIEEVVPSTEQLKENEEELHDIPVTQESEPHENAVESVEESVPHDTTAPSEDLIEEVKEESAVSVTLNSEPDKEEQAEEVGVVTTTLQVEAAPLTENVTENEPVNQESDEFKVTEVTHVETVDVPSSDAQLVDETISETVHPELQTVTIEEEVPQQSVTNESIPTEATEESTTEPEPSVPQETHEIPEVYEVTTLEVSKDLETSEIPDDASAPVVEVPVAEQPLADAPTEVHVEEDLQAQVEEELTDIPVELVDEPEQHHGEVLEVENAAEPETHPPTEEISAPPESDQIPATVPVVEVPSAHTELEAPSINEQQLTESTPEVVPEHPPVEEEIIEAPKTVAAVHSAPTPVPTQEDAQEPEPEAAVLAAPVKTDENGIDILVEIIDKVEEEQQEAALKVNSESKLLSASGDRIHVIGHNHQIQRPPSPELVDIPIETEDAVVPSITVPVQSAPESHPEGEQNGDTSEEKPATDEKGRIKIGSKAPGSPEATKKKKHGGLLKLLSCMRAPKE